jgi:hypothetical protein
VVSIGPPPFLMAIILTRGRGGTRVLLEDIDARMPVYPLSRKQYILFI